MIPFPAFFRRFLALATVASTAGGAGAASTAVEAGLASFAAARNRGLPDLGIDLTRAVLVASAELSEPERNAVAMLAEEVEKRTLAPWGRRAAMPAGSEAAVVVGTFAQVRALLGSSAERYALREADVAPEGYQLVTLPPEPGRAARVAVAGRDARGVLFGVGELLRRLSLGPARAGLLQPVNHLTSPRYALRGHQLGYRPKPNSYSGWDIPQWRQYIRELAIFGCNAIELLPPRTDDLPDSPHFPRPPIETMVAMSKIAAEHGLDVWIWYPALDDDYGDPAVVARAIAEWGAVFEALPRVDAVLVPGGDPGHTPARLMFPFLERQAANLRRHHPNATLWLSPQGFKAADMEFFFDHLRERAPDWLAGVVFAPWIHLELAEFRRRVPARYPIRYYPDITHTKECQYPVADWDPAFALTQGREPICPRPRDMARILRLLQPHTIGAVTYSEGVNDDVNKAVWSALSWDPDRPVEDVLRDYARFFLGERQASAFAGGLLALEDNWRGPLAVNAGVDETLRTFQAMERDASPATLRNWRFQSALYRAYFDAFVRARLLHEAASEARANAILLQAPQLGSERAIAAATERLAQPLGGLPAEWRTRVFQLAEALFQTVNYKASVPLYRAVAQRRGATLDTLDHPLNNRLWLEDRFARIRKLATEEERRAALQALVRWTDPGPGGFYDDLGNVAAQPRLQPGVGAATDPAFIRTPMNGHFPADGPPQPLRRSWVDYVWGLNDLPVTLHYPALDPTASYAVRVVYPKFPPAAGQARLRLVANGKFEIHPYLTQPDPVAPLQFEIPRAATGTGSLTLTWNREPGLGGSGKGCEISEVWLVRTSTPSR